MRHHSITELAACRSKIYLVLNWVRLVQNLAGHWPAWFKAVQLTCSCKTVSVAYQFVTYIHIIICASCFMQATPLITNVSVGYIQHITFAVCPSYVDTAQLINGPCNDISWLCYYGDRLPGWNNGGGVCA